jgi:hypothetical protein
MDNKSLEQYYLRFCHYQWIDTSVKNESQNDLKVFGSKKKHKEPKQQDNQKLFKITYALGKGER